MDKNIQKNLNNEHRNYRHVKTFAKAFIYSYIIWAIPFLLINMPLSNDDLLSVVIFPFLLAIVALATMSHGWEYIFFFLLYIVVIFGLYKISATFKNFKIPITVILLLIWYCIQFYLGALIAVMNMGL